MWYNTNWKYRVKITVDHTKVPSTQSNFPAYVDLSSLPAGFFLNVNTDGGDIRVTTSDGTTECPIEIVAIDTTGKTGELHFKAPSLSSTVDTDFYIYYGKTNPFGHSLALVATSSQYVSITDAAVLHPSGHFTVEFKLKIDSLPAVNATIFQSWDNNGTVGGFRAELQSSGAMRFLMGKNTGTSSGTDFKLLDSNTALGTSKIYHIALRYDGSTMKIFINGVEDNSVSWANNAVYDSTNYITIGVGNDSGTPTNYATVKVHDVRLWGTDRTATQIADNANTKLVGNESNLLGYWPLDNSYNDLTSNANNGTPHGSPTFSTSVMSQLYLSPATFGSQNVWDSNFLGVYHFESNGNDSTSNARNMTAHGSPTYEASVLGGKALKLNGTSQYMTIPGSSWLAIAALQMETLAKTSAVDAVNASQIIIADNGNGGATVTMRADSSTEAQARLMANGSITVNIDATGLSNLADSAWKSWVFKWDKAAGSPNAKFLINNSSIGTDNNGSSNPTATTNNTYIGSYFNGSQGFWKDDLDEMRFSKIARSDDWNTTTYNSLLSNATFYKTIGFVDVYPYISPFPSHRNLS